MSHHSPIQQRLRITFGKSGPLTYTGNLDIAKLWERVLRRAELPILYTQGFNTRPRIQIAAPLALGISSDCEVVDIALRQQVSIMGLEERLLAVSPPGLSISQIEMIDPNAPATQTLVRSGRYRVHFLDPVDAKVLGERVAALLSADQLVRIEEKKGGKKSAYDLRPLILDLEVAPDGDLLAHVSIGERGNLRPDKLLDELGMAEQHVTIHRYELTLTEG